jgi:hypothetical protein
MPLRRNWVFGLILAGEFVGASAFAQIDPDKRQLLQLGYNASFKGHAPIAGYAFYYLNRPEFYRDDMTLRMAIAPVYFDSELGLAHALGPDTDIGVGIAGGGFADSYNEVRRGKYFTHESFDGHGGGASVSLYHRFNPAQRIPLYGILRGGLYYATYTESDETAGRFELPEDRASANFRLGFRLGGKEPVLFPSVAMELSLWAESLNRGNSGRYGFNRDRKVEESAELFYAHAYLAYTFERGDNLSVSITGGDSVNPDRFSAYRLGGVLPLVAEYPLIIPGYFFQEISARRFALFNGRYAVALDESKRWQVNVMAATAFVDYLHGLDQPGNWHSGVGGGLGYESPSETWKASLNYGFGIDAIRSGERGAHVVSLVLQFDLEKYLNKRRSKPFWWEFQ